MGGEGKKQRERSIFSTSANKIFHPWNVDGRRLDRVDRWKKKEMIETQKRGRGFPSGKGKKKLDGSEEEEEKEEVELPNGA